MKLANRARSLALVTALSATSIGLATAPARAESAPTDLRNGNTGRCIDDSWAYGLRSFPCMVASVTNGYQSFTFDWRSFGDSGGQAAQIQNLATGQCLDDSDEYGLRHYPCNDPSFNSGYQAWNIWFDGYGDMRLSNVMTGRCIDDSLAYGLRSFPCFAGSYDNGYQRWYDDASF